PRDRGGGPGGEGEARLGRVSTAPDGGGAGAGRRAPGDRRDRRALSLRDDRGPAGGGEGGGSAGAAGAAGRHHRSPQPGRDRAQRRGAGRARRRDPVARLGVGDAGGGEGFGGRDR